MAIGGTSSRVLSQEFDKAEKITKAITERLKDIESVLASKAGEGKIYMAKAKAGTDRINYVKGLVDGIISAGLTSIPFYGPAAAALYNLSQTGDLNAAFSAFVVNPYAGFKGTADKYNSLAFWLVGQDISSYGPSLDQSDKDKADPSNPLKWQPVIGLGAPMLGATALKFLTGDDLKGGGYASLKGKESKINTELILGNDKEEQDNLLESLRNTNEALRYMYYKLAQLTIGLDAGKSAKSVTKLTVSKIVSSVDIGSHRGAGTSSRYAEWLQGNHKIRTGSQFKESDFPYEDEILKANKEAGKHGVLGLTKNKYTHAMSRMHTNAFSSQWKAITGKEEDDSFIQQLVPGVTDHKERKYKTTTSELFDKKKASEINGLIKSVNELINFKVTLFSYAIDYCLALKPSMDKGVAKFTGLPNDMFSERKAFNQALSGMKRALAKTGGEHHKVNESQRILGAYMLGCYSFYSVLEFHLGTPIPVSIMPTPHNDERFTRALLDSLFTTALIIRRVWADGCKDMKEDFKWRDDVQKKIFNAVTIDNNLILDYWKRRAAAPVKDIDFNEFKKAILETLPIWQNNNEINSSNAGEWQKMESNVLANAVTLTNIQVLNPQELAAQKVQIDNRYGDIEKIPTDGINHDTSDAFAASKLQSIFGDGTENAMNNAMQAVNSSPKYEALSLASRTAYARQALAMRGVMSGKINEKDGLYFIHKTVQNLAREIGAIRGNTNPEALARIAHIMNDQKLGIIKEVEEEEE